MNAAREFRIVMQTSNSFSFTVTTDLVVEIPHTSENPPCFQEMISLSGNRLLGFPRMFLTV